MSFLAFSANQMKAPSLLVDNLNIYRGVTPEHSAFLGMNLELPPAIQVPLYEVSELVL
jgi:hypothetical protein